jgi:hypothetical protein
LDRTGATVEARVFASLGDSEVGTGVLKGGRRRKLEEN